MGKLIDSKYTIEELLLKSDEELKKLGYKKDKNGALRNSKGHFLPGQSGNSTGRPVRVRESLKTLPKDFKGAIKGKEGTDAKKALETLLETATTRREAHMIAKDLLPYQAPKLANIEQTSNERKEIVIKWADPIAQVGKEHEFTDKKAVTDEQTLEEIKGEVARTIIDD